MTLLSEYYVPGLHIEDRSIKVPLDWAGHEPGHGFDGESISNPVDVMEGELFESPMLPNMCMTTCRYSCSCRAAQAVPVHVRSAQVPMAGSRKRSSISAWYCRINVVRGVRLVSTRM